MEKAIEIKRRAQRCVQNGDLDGALSEYEKLVAGQDADPYNFVLLADLLFKKGETGQASMRYLSAAKAYEANGLYKNAIAVCKKLMRLSLAPLEVIERLAKLHALDGLATESALYYVQYADLVLAQNDLDKAIVALEKAFEVSPENVKALEKLGEARILNGQTEEAARTLHEAARLYDRAAQIPDAQRCRIRASQIMPGFKPDTQGPAPAPAGRPARVPGSAPEPGTLELDRKAAPAEAASQADSAALENLEIDSGPFAPAAVDPGRSHGPPRLPSDRVSAPRAPEPVAEDEVEHEPSSNGDVDDAERGESPPAPGLRFAPDAGAPALAGADAGGPGGPGPSLARVEQLLAEAQECFRAGQRDAASRSLASAAQAYETLGRLDSAATIYRSLGKSAHATPEVLELWLANCERRGDRAEAAQVACELGDRALNDGDADQARTWFERAHQLDEGNDLSLRRLQRLAPVSAPGSVATLAPPAPTLEPAGAEAPAEAPASPAAAPDATGLPEPGRVEVAVGRGEAVTFDLGSLISEFQRGVEAHLSGDAQGQYDLGMAYREMGLLEQAVESFRMSGQDPAYRDRCVEMIGRCLLDQGRFDDASQAFEEALAEGAADPALAVNLRYLLGLAHEAAGRGQEAMAEFERVYAAQPSFPDVALKIRVLRKTLESL